MNNIDQPIDYVWKTYLELSDCSLDGRKIDGVKVLVMATEPYEVHFTVEDVRKMAEVLGMVVL